MRIRAWIGLTLTLESIGTTSRVVTPDAAPGGASDGTRTGGLRRRTWMHRRSMHRLWRGRCRRSCSDLVLELALHHQGVGARRGAAPRPHDPGGQGRRSAPGLLAHRDAVPRSPLRLVTLDVPPQDIITRDNVSVKVNAVCYFRVVDANRAFREVAELSLRHLAARADDAAQRRRPVRARRNPLRARKGQREAAASSSTRTPSLGHQGHQGRSQAGGHSRDDAARHRPPGGGRARAPRQGHPRRRASSRRRRSWPTPRRCSKRSRPRSSCATCRR